MIARKVHIRHWTIMFMFSFDTNDAGEIEDALIWANAPSSVISQVSENVYANAPTAPAPRTAMPLPSVSVSTSLRAKAVIVQKRKRIVKADASAESALTHIAT